MSSGDRIDGRVSDAWLSWVSLKWVARRWRGCRRSCSAMIAVAAVRGRRRWLRSTGRPHRICPTYRRSRASRRATALNSAFATIGRRSRRPIASRSLVHGSSGGSRSMHTLAQALAARGVETFAIDVRGHGASGTRGDIGYLGQLDDDLADLVGHDPQHPPTAAITLVGFSSGGGFALRVAGSPIQNLFARTSCWRPISATTRRPAGRVPAAGRTPIFRAFSVWWHCARSA